MRGRTSGGCAGGQGQVSLDADARMRLEPPSLPWVSSGHPGAAAPAPPGRDPNASPAGGGSPLFHRVPSFDPTRGSDRLFRVQAFAADELAE
jgi:hypothetical protein